jgi:hypothetical protein
MRTYATWFRNNFMAVCTASTLLSTAAANGYFGLDDRSLKIAALQLLCSASNVTPTSGTGSPEGVVTGDPGRTYSQTDGNHFYYKKTGTGNTGWIAVL